MARTNKTQQYAILWLNSTGKDYTEIAKELDLELKQVQRVLEKSRNVNQQSSVKTTSEVAKKPASKDLMIRHTSAKRNNSVAIMTKEASEVNDHAKKVNQAHPNTNKNIFRPNG
jgi:hypothetical protein